VKLGLVGLPASGKTTIFHALTEGKSETHPTDPHAPRIASVKVPDPRVDFLAEMYKPKRVVHASIDYVDIRGIMAEAGREENARLLASLREADALVHVVRLFESQAAPHPRGTLDPARDIREINDELLFADLAIAEPRIEKLKKSVAHATPHLAEEKQELAVLLRCREAIETGRRIIGLALAPEEAHAIRAFRFLTEKPMILLLNVGEKEIKKDFSALLPSAEAEAKIVMCGEMEKEIASLEPADRPAFLADLGIEHPAGDLLKAASYRALRQRTFFTVNEAEAHAWHVTEGDNAVTAAGKVHTDMARGFIRAEVIRFDDLKAAGSMKEARAHGKVKVEGRDYLVQDGDVIYFRFSV
jgi:GTP-binding protein YchF